MSLIVKIHKKSGRALIAVCDSNLLGRLFEENGKQLDLSSDFYKGEERDPVEIGDLIRNADMVNLVGEESIKLGLQEEVIEESHILKIDGVPHAQAVLITD